MNRRARAKAFLAHVAQEAAPKEAAERLSVLDGLARIDADLVRCHFPPLSPWWWQTIRRWYGGTARRAVLRVGRGGGKSSSLSRLAVAEALYGPHRVTPGDVGTVAIVSVDRREAGRRIVTIRAILNALGVAYRPIDGGVQLLDRPIAFQVFTATIAGVSGFTSIFVICDEVAKWRDADTGANPANEVLSSLAPTFRGRQDIHMALSSSPLGELDAHAKAFRDGDTDAQIVAYASSFEANPTMDEAATHLDEPDPAKWRREYLAVPMEGTEESLYSAAMLDACTGDAGPHPRHGWSYIAAMDPATRGNGWTLVVATSDGSRRILVAQWEWRGSPSKPLDPEALFGEMAPLLQPFGIHHVHTDQHGFDYMAGAARKPHVFQAGGIEVRWPLSLVLQQITHGSKLSLFEGFGVALRTRSVLLPADKRVRADLLGVRRKITPAGQTIALQDTPDGRHCDFAQPVAMVGSMLHCPAPRALPETPAAKLEAAIEKAEVRRFGKEKPALMGLRKQRPLSRLPK